jgi:hypothetical protein
MGCTMRARHGRRASSLRAPAALGLAAVLAIGCGSPGPTRAPIGGPEPTLAASAPPATPTGPALSQEIPPGREISEGGGGPAQYTFREEWRRALAEAQRWRDGAYLVTAAGEMVNDEGVPSHWALTFTDKPDADAVLLVEVDPWGKVTQTREVTGDGVSSFVDEYTNRMPVDVIDSDTAVGLGAAALASRYDPAVTRDPRLGLHFSSRDGSGPYWTYTLFDEATADYVSAEIDALTGRVLPPK